MNPAKSRYWFFIGCMLSLLVSCAAALTDNGEDYFPIRQKGKIGFIDKTGKIVITPQFDSTLSADGRTFSEGLAAVQLGDNWGYIDKAGKFVIPPKFKQRSPPSLFHEGLAQVATKNGGFGFIDKSGEFVKALSFIKDHTEFSEGLVKISEAGKFGYVG